MDINVVNLSGRLGKKPELKTGNNGVDFCGFSLATNTWNGKEEVTSWIDVVAFGSTAKFVSTYLDAGDQVFVNGAISVTTYEKDGQKRTRYSVKATNVISGAKKSGRANNVAEADLPTPSAPVMTEVESGEELPF